MTPFTGESNPSESLLMLTFEIAQGKGLKSVALLRRALGGLDESIIATDYRKPYSVVLELLSEGKPPTMAATRARLVGYPVSFWAELRSGYASLDSALDAVKEAHSLDVARGLLASVKSSLERGVPSTELWRSVKEMSNQAAHVSPRVLEASELEVLRYFEDAAKGDSPIFRTGCADLDENFNGGLPFGGQAAHTAVLMFSGMGKSSLLGQWNHQALEDGHWTVTFTGEASALEAKSLLMRYRAGVSKATLAPGTAIHAATRQRLSNAEAWVNSRKAFFFDRVFDTGTIEAIVLSLLARLEKAKSAGEAKPKTQLVIGVDNLDHTASVAAEDGWKQLYSAAQDLERLASEYPIHIVSLCQANDKSYDDGRLPRTNEFALSKRIVQHFGNIVVGYRPVTNEDKTTEGRNHARIGIRKTRIGNVWEGWVDTDDGTGFWRFRQRSTLSLFSDTGGDRSRQK